jgi:hypothetical protein
MMVSRCRGSGLSSCLLVRCGPDNGSLFRKATSTQAEYLESDLVILSIDTLASEPTLGDQYPGEQARQGWSLGRQIISLEGWYKFVASEMQLAITYDRSCYSVSRSVLVSGSSRSTSADIQNSIREIWPGPGESRFRLRRSIRSFVLLPKMTDA